MHYVSAFDALMKEGLSGVVKVLSAEMRARKANLIVLDGLVTAAGGIGIAAGPEGLHRPNSGHIYPHGLQHAVAQQLVGTHEHEPRADDG